MSQILEINTDGTSIDRQLLNDGDFTVVSQREFAKIADGGVPASLSDRGPGILFSAPVTLAGATDEDEIVASITPGFRGRVVSAFALVTAAVTTGGDAADVDVLIDRDPGTNEVQSLVLNGGATAGTFTLTFDGQETGNLAFNADAATTQTALLALSNLAPGDVVVTGGPFQTAPTVVTFGGAYAGTDVALITGDPALLTGGTDDAIVATVTTPGAAGTDEAAGRAVSEVALTSALATPAGKVIPGSLVVDAAASTPNDFTATSVIQFKARDITAFAEGAVAFGVIVAPARKPGPVEY